MSEYEEQKMQEVHEEIKRVYNDPLLPTKNAENSQKKRLKLQQLKKKSCRACLHETPASFISLYAKYKGEYVAQMLSFCTNLEVI